MTAGEDIMELGVWRREDKTLGRRRERRYREDSDSDTTWTTGESELHSRKSRFLFFNSLLHNGHSMMFPIGLSRPERST
jgi:hypothetical protein